MLYRKNQHIVILVLINAENIGTQQRNVKKMLQNDGKWRAQHPDYFLINTNCPLCNKVVLKRNLTRHQRSQNCKRLQPKEYIYRQKGIILVWQNKYCIHVTNVSRGKMILRFHTN